MLAAVASRSLPNASAFVMGREAGSRNGHGDYAALIADPGVDTVYIVTPDPLRWGGPFDALGRAKRFSVKNRTE